jgi:hypothetical protein
MGSTTTPTIWDTLTNLVSTGAVAGTSDYINSLLPVSAGVGPTPAAPAVVATNSTLMGMSTTTIIALVVVLGLVGFALKLHK